MESLASTRARYNFQYLWLGHFVSTLGERLSYAALIILASQLSGVKFGSTLVMSIYTLAFVFAAPLAGSWVDHFPKRALLIWMDLLRAILVLAYIPFVDGEHPYWAKLLFYLLISVVVALCAVARSGFWSMIPEAVERDQIAQLNARTAISSDIALTIGTALGGVLISRIHFEGVFVLDSLTYLISAILLLPILPLRTRVGPSKELSASKKKPSVLFSWARLRPVLVVPGLSRVLGLAIPVYLMVGALSSFIVIAVDLRFHKAQEFIGFIYAAWAFGGLAAGVLYRSLWVRKMLTQPKALIFSSIVCGGVGVLPGLTWSIDSFFLATALAGLSFTFTGTLLNTQAMLICPQEMSGRFSSALMAVVRLSMFLGLWVGSAATESFYPFAILSLVLAAVLLFQRKLPGAAGLYSH